MSEDRITFWVMLAATNIGWIIGTVLYHAQAVCR